MGTWKEYNKKKKKHWIGKKVEFEGTSYVVVDVDYNGVLYINKPARFTDTTAVGEEMVKVL